MYEFLERLLLHLYQGLETLEELVLTGFDGRGNYNMGIKEQIIFLKLILIR
jgi:large subunit ribosomal protein L5